MKFLICSVAADRTCPVVADLSIQLGENEQQFGIIPPRVWQARWNKFLQLEVQNENLAGECERMVDRLGK